MDSQTNLLADLFKPGPAPRPLLEVAGVESKWIRRHMENGCTCPLCGQHVKLYRRKITGEMARVLLLLYRHFKKYPHSNPVHVDSFLSAVCGRRRPKGNNHSLLVHWGLLVKCPPRVARSTGEKRDGYYRITISGRSFIRQQCTVSKYAFIYNNKRIGWSDEDVGLRDVIESRFNLEELLDAPLELREEY